MFKLQQLHKVYGPVVRINPHEIHVDDASWVDKLYVGAAGGQRDKYPPAARLAGTPEAVFGTVHHDIHRRRRTAISSLFSKAAVATSESIIHRNTNLLLKNIEKQITQTGSAELRKTYLALATDNIIDYCFDESLNLLGSDERATAWKKTIDAVACLNPVVRQFNWMIPLAMYLPLSLLEILHPDMTRIVKLRRDMEVQARSTIKMYSDSEQGKKRSDGRQNLYQAILSSNVLPPAEKTAYRMAQEGFVSVGAGAETTAMVLTAATFHILTNHDQILLPLKEELNGIMTNRDINASLKDLERLPWLSAIIKESLRITGLISSRLPLISPKEPLQYRNWVIPPRTPVSMTLRDILLDPNVFDNPMEFRPERWLSGNPDLERIGHNWLPFGRGGRMCLGMHFALAELYIVLAAVFGDKEFELHDTIRSRDIDAARDCFVGEVSPDSLGVRIRYGEAQLMNGMRGAAMI
ncbi:Cytochrome P450 monooxygenase hepH [Cladobotryum mycophilum]|uniref:Cytochrome P450 monooxygenase hepH n=1 Tax=Cladobotryum mycophilum TaxID=491253 RepID=A0ABR0T5E5_9HYPO